MSVSKVLAEAEEAWREGKKLYLVQLTEMPLFRDMSQPPSAKVEPWEDESLPSEERERLNAEWKHDRRVMSERMTDIEECVEAIIAVGWELRDLRFVDYGMMILGSKMTLNRAQVAFVRPTASL